MGSVAIAELAAGRTLGGIIGGLFAATLLAPIFSSTSRRVRDRLFACAAVVVGIAVVWISYIHPDAATFAQWLSVSTTMAAYALALVGIGAAMETCRVNATISAAFAIFLGLAWMTWPLWASPLIASGAMHSIALLVRLHPGLVANGVLTFTPPWTEQTIAYRWTVLDQDVMIALPTSAMLCIIAHTAVGAICLLLSFKFKPSKHPSTPNTQLPTLN